MASKYDLEAVFNLIDKVTKPLEKIGANSKTVSDKIKRDFTAAQKKLDNLGKALVKWGKRALAAAGAAVAAFVGIGVKNAIALADTMAKIGTVAGDTGPPLNELQKNLTDAANAAGFTVQELADIAYIAIPSGIAAEASAEFASTVAKTAKVTGTASEQIVDGLTTVLNAYGMGAEEAARISGMMFTANKLGKTSFQDMAAGMKSVIPIASQYGLAADDVFASITALTAKGLNTKDAMKTLGDSISAVTHPSKNAAALAQRLGLDFSEAAVRSKGWAGFLDDVRKKTGGNTQILEALFGNEKIARSMGILATSGAQAFNDALSEMGNAMNTIDEQFAKVTDTPAERWKKAINKIQNSGTALGTALLPLVERVIGKVTEIADHIAAIDFSQFTGTLEKVFNAVEGFVGALIGAIKIAWQFRGIILAITIAVALYKGAIMAAVIATNAKNIITAIATGYEIAHATVIRGSASATAALGLATEGTAAATAAWSVILKIAHGIQKIYAWQMQNVSKILKFLKLDIVGAKIATVGHAIAVKSAAAFQKIFALTTTVLSKAFKFLKLDLVAVKIQMFALTVAQKAATVGQWLLNVAMNMNPIGLVVIAILALIGVIAALIKWGHKAAAVFMTIAAIFTGPVGLAIGFAISAIVELIKGWGSVTKAFKDGGILAAIKQIGALLLSGILGPIQGLLELLAKIPGVDKLLGPAVQGLNEFRNKLKGIEGTQLEASVNMPDEVAAELSPLGGIPGIEIPDINMPEIGMPDMGGASGRNPLHGVVDISGGAAQIPLNGIPGMQTATSAVSASAVRDTIPQSLLSIDRAMQSTLAVIKNIDATTTAMSNALPALRTGQEEREAAEREDPRRIAPVSREERMAYSLQERRDTVGIEVSAAQGSRASITRHPRSPNIELTNSGGNR